MLKIEVIASSIIEEDHFPHGFRATAGTADADALAEFAGRACYQSWERPNPETATNDGYISNIIDHGHFSVLEHASVTLYIQGVSRALTHELVRHRHFSPSQLSQRFVDESAVTFVVPPAIRDYILTQAPECTVEHAERAWGEAFEGVRKQYADLVANLTAAGLGRKETREAARAVLPNCTETKIVLTGNLRCWREFFLKRNAPGVDAEMREFAVAALAVVREFAPASFQDFDWNPAA